MVVGTFLLVIVIFSAMLFACIYTSLAVSPLVCYGAVWSPVAGVWHVLASLWSPELQLVYTYRVSERRKKRECECVFVCTCICVHLCVRGK